MMFRQFLSKHIFLLSAVPLLFLHCAAGNRNRANTLISRYPGAGTISLVEEALVEGLVHQFRCFGDTTGKESAAYLWNMCRHTSVQSSFNANTEPLMVNIKVMACVLKNRGYTVGTIAPCTYEAIYALSKLPVLIWVLIIHHDNSPKTLLTDKNISIFDTTLLSRYADHMQLHLISSIDKSVDGYQATTHDGTTLQGLVNDKLNGQILSVEKNEAATYIQIVDCFIVTLLPFLECNEHLAEWYEPFRYMYEKPMVKEIK